MSVSVAVTGQADRGGSPRQTTCLSGSPKKLRVPRKEEEEHNPENPGALSSSIQPYTQEQRPPIQSLARRAIAGSARTHSLSLAGADGAHLSTHGEAGGQGVLLSCLVVRLSRGGGAVLIDASCWRLNPVMLRDCGVLLRPAEMYVFCDSIPAGLPLGQTDID